MLKYEITNSFALDYISRRRVFFPFVTPNILAGYLIMIILLASAHKQKFWLILPLSAALLLTKSLGALLTIFVIMGLYFYLQNKLGKEKIVFLLGLLFTIGMIFIFRANTHKQHHTPFFSTIMRLNYWRDTLMLIKAHPLTGLGPGNFNLAYARYAHNSYLQVWAEMGILGIAAWLWIIFEFFKSGFRKLRSYGNQDCAYATLLAASAAFLLHNLIDFSFFLPEVSFIWWVILGLSSE